METKTLSPGYYLSTKNVPTNCSYFDAAVPGTGPMGLVCAKAPSTEFEKWNGSFNYSLKSKSDSLFNLNNYLKAGFGNDFGNKAVILLHALLTTVAINGVGAR